MPNYAGINPGAGVFKDASLDGEAKRDAQKDNRPVKDIFGHAGWGFGVVSYRNDNESAEPHNE